MTITLSDGRSNLYQWDTGRTVVLDFDAAQCHFEGKAYGRTVDVDVKGKTAIIPDVLLQKSGKLRVFAFVGTPDEGYTKIEKTFDVVPRNKPSDYVFTPTEQITLATAVTTAIEAKATADSVRADADAGKFNGAQGIQGEKGDKGDTGAKGDKGDKGDPGAAGKSAYASAQDGGFTGTEAQFNKGLSVMGQVDGVEDADTLGIDTTVTQNSGNLITSGAVYTFAKTASSQGTPLFAQSVDELNASGDKTKVYVLPDGYIYAYRTFKNYNLLKLSEVSYSSRLQNDVAGIIASNANNLVTGWIPVKYGKYYTPSILFNGSRIVGNSAFSLIVRVNVKLADGTIIVYGNTFDDRNKILYTPGVNETITLEQENAVAVMLHFFINNQDISTQTKFEAYQPMVIEGNSIEDATNKATTYEYISGDVEEVANWYNTGHAFVPADYEDRIINLESEVNKIRHP